ncbi:hypothetical protein [Mycolicibacterium iranicum]|nr:hypothetical protein [Mycolicibacterium iranicum]
MINEQQPVGETSPQQPFAGPRMSPESLTALTESVVEGAAIPKKIPAVDDLDGQRQSVVGALASALLTATEMPVSMSPEVVGLIADQLIAYGVRQTDQIDQNAIHAPAWITDGVRQEAIKQPEQPLPTESEPFTAQTATAPACPKRIAKAARAVRL